MDPSRNHNKRLKQGTLLDCTISQKQPMKSLLLFCHSHGRISSQIAAVSEDCATSRGTSCFLRTCIATRRRSGEIYHHHHHHQRVGRSWRMMLMWQYYPIKWEQCIWSRHAVQSVSVLLFPWLPLKSQDTHTHTALILHCSSNLSAVCVFAAASGETCLCGSSEAVAEFSNHFLIFTCNLLASAFEHLFWNCRVIVW